MPGKQKELNTCLTHASYFCSLNKFYCYLLICCEVNLPEVVNKVSKQIPSLFNRVNNHAPKAQQIKDKITFLSTAFQ